MTNANDVRYKVYLRHNSTVKEIRRINMNLSTNNFTSFCTKIREAFSELNDKNFTVTWIDREGDEIVISCNEDYDCANFELGEIKKLYVTISSQTAGNKADHKEKVIHSNVECDGCNGAVIGFRYKCLECPNFDLCSECETAGKHADHSMIRISQPWHCYNRKFQHIIGKVCKKTGIHQKRSCQREDYLPNKIHCTVKPWVDMLLDDLIGNYIIENEERNDTNTAFDSSQAQETENKPKEATNADEYATKKFPGEGRKLNDKQKKNDESGSDTASVASQIDEWTVINNTAEGDQAPSTSSKVDETKKVPSTSNAPSAPEEPSTKENYSEVVHHKDPLINEAIEAMLRMGFSNDGGLLSCLLEHQKGNINNVIEILSPGSKK